VNRFTLVNQRSSYLSRGGPLSCTDLRFDLICRELLAMQAATAIVLKANHFQLALTAIHPRISQSLSSQGPTMRLLRSVAAAFIALIFWMGD